MQGVGGFLRRLFVAPLFIIAQKHDTIDVSAIHRRNEIPYLFPLPADRSLFLEVATTPSPQEIWNGRALKLEGLNCITWSKNALSAICTTFSSNNNQSGQEEGDGRGSMMETSKASPYQRSWTNVLLASIVLVYVAQIATKGRLMLWRPKINAKIDQGELRRLVTSSFLHVNIRHLLINCNSLNSIGPSVETTCGPQGFIAIYFTSAVTSSAMSYWLCKAPSVGASGAISGLVGSIAVFALRHRCEKEKDKRELQELAIVIALNMAVVLVWKGIDNWGHLGGLLGGFAVTWFLATP